MSGAHRALALTCALAACSPDATSSQTPDVTSASETTGSDVQLETFVSDTSGGTLTGCAKRATNIYVLSTDNDLYRFEPGEKQFTKIGALGCDAGLALPNSMAIARDGTACVDYVSTDLFLGTDDAGFLFEVSTEDASCKPAASTTLPINWRRLGMGFVARDLDHDGLFVTGTGDVSAGLGRIDPSSGALTPIAAFGAPFAGQSAELTGTADGRLFAFFVGDSMAIAEVDPDDASIVDHHTVALTLPAAWAFSIWRNDFYLYTADAPLGVPEPSRVSRYNYDSDTLETDYIANVGFTIVGAGVSTCATVE